MKVSRFFAIVLLLLNMWPLAHILFFMGFILVTLASIPANPPPHAAIVVLVSSHLLAMLIQFLLVAFYAIYVIRHPAIPQDQKVLWLIAVVFLNIIIMPFFWYLYIWKPSGKKSEFVGQA